MKFNSKILQITFISTVFLILAVANLEKLNTNIKVKAELNANNLNSNMVKAESESENISNNRFKFSAEQKMQFDKIPKPTLSNKLPENIKFMQKEITKAYSLAISEENPRFMEASTTNKKFMSLFPIDKREEGIPVNRQTYIDIIYLF